MFGWLEFKMGQRFCFSLKRFWRFIAALLMVGAFAGQSNAQFGGEAPFPPLGDLQAQYNSYNMDVLGDDLVGDHIDVDTGSLSITQMDVSIPGNSGLPVAFGRMKSRNGFQGSSNANTNDTWLGDWSTAIPYISRHYLPDFAPNTPRCTGQLYPDLINDQSPSVSYAISAESYFNGFSLNIPGQNPGALAQELNGGHSPEFAGTAARMVSKNNWIVTCLASAQSGGEGFIATAPNGNKYTFGFRQDYYDRVITVPVHDPNKPFSQTLPNYFNSSASHAVYEEVLYVTKIEDVNGNWVNYEYTGGRPSRIISNDNREITFSYSGDYSESKISSITTHPGTPDARTWRYQYDNNGALYKVIEPDLRFWTLSTASPVFAPDAPGICAEHNSTNLNSVTITHPSGTTVRFDFTVIKNGRTHMTIVESGPDTPDPTIESCFIGNSTLRRTSQTGFYSFAVTHKTLTLASGEIYVWQRDYEQDDGSWTDASSHPADTKKRTITDPLGHKTVIHINRRFDNLEGSIMKTESIPAGSSIPIQIVENSYIMGNGIGIELAGRHFGSITNGSKTTRIYKTQTVTTRDGDTFTSKFDYQTAPAASDFAYNQPKATRVSSNTSPTERVTTTTYAHDTSKWILGLPDVVTISDGGTPIELSDTNYDTFGRKASQTRYGAPYATFNYNSDGTIHWIEDALGRRTTALDWHRGTPQEIKRPDNISTYQTVDNNGWLTSTTDAKGYTTSYQQDPMGRLTKIIPHKLPSGQQWLDTVIAYNFTGGGAVQTITKGEALTKITYDSLFRPVQEMREDTTLGANGDTIYTKTDYDPLGRAVKTYYPAADALGSAHTAMTYDALGRAKTRTQSVAPYAQTETQYLPGHKTRSIDAEGNITDSFANGYGEAVKIVQHIGVLPAVTTDMTRNILGQLLTVTQSGDTGTAGFVSATQSYSYDSQYRLCRHDKPESEASLYAYDAAGQMTYKAEGVSGHIGCDPYGGTKLVNYSYTPLGQLDIADYTAPNTPDTAFTYDANGNIEEARRGFASLDPIIWSYTYDELNNPLTEELALEGKSFELSYAYSLEGFLDSRTLPSGRIVNYSYDGLGRAAALSSGATNYADTISYHPSGAVSAMTYGNGQIFTQSLNTRLLPEQLKTAKPGGLLALRLTYGYDKNGKVLSMLDDADSASAHTRNYLYDDLGRLTSASGPWGNGTFSYDALGNLRSKTLGSRTVTNSYDMSKNRLTATTADGTTRNIAYNGRGMIKKIGAMNLNLDKADQLTATSGSVTSSYRHDGNYKRVKAVMGGKTHYNVYDLSGTLVHIFNETDAEQTDYIKMGSQTLARIKKVGGADTVTYLHADHLGSAVVGTNAAGGHAWDEVYYPYGGKYLSETANDNQAGFTGHISDTATGFIYMQARYYEPDIGFLSIDPVTFMDTGEPGYFNRYAYAFNNPINNFDPTGMSCESLGEGCTFGPRNPETGEFTFKEQKQFSAETTEGIAFGGEKISEMAGTVGLGTTRLASEAKVGTTKALGKVGQSLMVGSRTTKAIGGSADDFVAANSSRLGEKLGAKLGQGRLPFEASKAGFDDAVSAVRNTLASPSRITGNFTTSGGNVARDIFSKTTGMTVRVRRGGQFDTLIPEISDRF